MQITLLEITIFFNFPDIILVVNNMKVIKTIAELQNIRNSLQQSVGFVPTMGYLHAGHVSLVELAQKETENVFVSIFVNPKQFGPHDDFQKYPRDIDRDLELLKKTKTTFVFLPEVAALYPEGYDTYVSLHEITKKLEGAVRPNHFTGVATVLTKLFHLVQPTKAYFGQKDAQQVVVVKKMVADLHFPVEIVVGPTVREVDGLAMSSRNVFLDPKQRMEASFLYQSLCLAKTMFVEGEGDSEKILSAMEKLIHKTSGMIEYISITNPQTLEDVRIVKKGTLISLAVRFGSTRLIDNIIV